MEKCSTVTEVQNETYYSQECVSLREDGIYVASVHDVESETNSFNESGVDRSLSGDKKLNESYNNKYIPYSSVVAVQIQENYERETPEYSGELVVGIGSVLGFVTGAVIGSGRVFVILLSFVALVIALASAFDKQKSEDEFTKIEIVTTSEIDNISISTEKVNDTELKQVYQELVSHSNI